MFALSVCKGSQGDGLFPDSPGISYIVNLWDGLSLIVYVLN